ncbi:MAG: hypothetical protein J3R72DRAFT_428706 [Linnemannia gamsii]|nr:MAG: hypothetical protein J3R72DRAFT_428706 [Linnemannia gamsii]
MEPFYLLRVIKLDTARIVQVFRESLLSYTYRTPNAYKDSLSNLANKNQHVLKNPINTRPNPTMSTPIKKNQPPHPAPPTSRSSGHLELTTEGGHALSQLEKTATLGRISPKSGSIPSITQGLATMQLGPANLLNPLGHHVVGYSGYESDAVSTSSGKSSRIGFRKRLSALIKGDRKARNTAAIAPPLQTPVRTGFCVHSAVNDAEVLAVALSPLALTQAVDAETIKVTIPTIQMQASTMNLASLLQDIFPKNVKPATLRTHLPKPRARFVACLGRQ